ncbi:MAG TPA: hypothetical protein VII36_02170 [Usitatibacter sp.]
MPSHPPAVTLFEALPELVHDIEAALVRLGRGKVADQLREAPLASWSYDDFAASTYLGLGPSIDPREIGEVISLQEEIGVSLDLDAERRVVGIEVSGYEEFLARLRARDA